MFTQYLFLNSHLFSGARELFHYLLMHPKMIGDKNYDIVFEGQYDLIEFKNRLLNSKIKYINKSSYFIDLVESNVKIQFKLRMCNYIFLIREPRYVLSKLNDIGFKPLGAYRYYSFRLRRIYEMAYKSENSVFLTWNELNTRSGLDLIERNFNITLPNYPFNKNDEFKYHEYLNKSNTTYQLYLAKIKNLKNVKSLM